MFMRDREKCKLRGGRSPDIAVALTAQLIGRCLNYPKTLGARRHNDEMVVFDTGGLSTRLLPSH